MRLVRVSLRAYRGISGMRVGVPLSHVGTRVNRYLYGKEMTNTSYTPAAVPLGSVDVRRYLEVCFYSTCIHYAQI